MSSKPIDRFVWQPGDIVISSVPPDVIVKGSLILHYAEDEPQDDTAPEDVEAPEGTEEATEASEEEPYDPHPDEEEIELDLPDLSEAEAVILLADMRGLLDELEGDLTAFAAPVKKKAETYEAALRRIQAQTQEELDSLVRSWANGNAPYDTAQRMGSALRKGALKAAQLGKLEKGQDAPLTKAEQAKVRAWIESQKKYLKGVNKYMRQTLDKHVPPKKGKATPEERAAIEAKAAEAIAHGAEVLTQWRMPLYTGGLRHVYEQARARFSLSIYPKSGATECGPGCLCRLEWGEDELGAFVLWLLGKPETEHCTDCPELAAHGPFREGEL